MQTNRRAWFGKWNHFWLPLPLSLFPSLLSIFLILWILHILWIFIDTLLGVFIPQFKWALMSVNIVYHNFAVYNLFDLLGLVVEVFVRIEIIRNMKSIYEWNLQVTWFLLLSKRSLVFRIFKESILNIRNRISKYVLSLCLYLPIFINVFLCILYILNLILLNMLIRGNHRFYLPSIEIYFLLFNLHPRFILIEILDIFYIRKVFGFRSTSFK